MATRIQLRRDTAANWTAVNPILADGEAGIETDTDKLKIGDGSTAWVSLAYFGSAGTGDVVGPSSAVDSNFAAFNTTTGKLIKDSGKKAADFAAASHTQAISTITDLQATLDSKQVYHGIQAAGALSFDNSTHILTIASGTNTYWYQGTKYTTASAITCDLDDFVALTANTLYYFYFDDASGTLKANATGFSTLKTKVPVATVHWNGSAGAIGSETHNYTRDLDWHTFSHTTIGARISPADFALTAPSSGSPTTVSIAGGMVWDEDLAHTFGTQTNCRVWYEVSAGVYTWVDSNSIYPTNVRFVDSANAYTLTDVSAAQYINVWLYASNDTSRGIYAFTETKATSGYVTTALARAATPPSLAGLNLSPELKLLYRIIMKGDETFVEATDYRASASLPAGGSTAPSASAVTFIPAGNIAATNVQTAIEELDTEKAIAGAVTTSGLTISTDKRLLGRDNSTAGAQAIEEISLGTGLSLDGSNVLTVTGGIGFIPYGTETSITDTANLAFNSFNIVTVTSADKTLTLPQIAASADYGKFVEIYIAPTTTKLITIDGYGTGAGDYIDGAANRVMWANESCRLVATSIGWLKQGGKSLPMLAGLSLSSDKTGVVSGVGTKLNISNVLITGSPNGMADTSGYQIVIKRAGKYNIKHSVQFSNTTSAGYVATNLYKGGSYYAGQNGYTTAGQYPITPPGITIGVTLAVTDYLELYAYHSLTGNNTVLGATDTALYVEEIALW